MRLMRRSDSYFLVAERVLGPIPPQVVFYLSIKAAQFTSVSGRWRQQWCAAEVAVIDCGRNLVL